MVASEALSLENQGVLSASRGTMSGANHRALIFRLGDISFLLALAQVVEVVEQTAEMLDAGRSDISRGIVSALWFRKTWIPVVDPALKLDIATDVEINDKTAIVLHSSEGNWALLVDDISELAVMDNFKSCSIPFLLKVSATGFYSRVKLLHDCPVVVFEPESYYGSTVCPG